MDSSFPFPNQGCVSRSPAVPHISHWPSEAHLRNSPDISHLVSALVIILPPNLHCGDIVQCQTYDRRSLLRWWPSRRPDTEVWTSPIDSTPYCLPLTLYHAVTLYIWITNTLEWSIYCIWVLTTHVKTWTSPIGSTHSHCRSRMTL